MRTLFILISLFIIFNLINTASQQTGILVKGKIIKPQTFGDFNSINDLKTLKVQLNSGLYTAFPNEDGQFRFNNIPVGQYILEVVSKQFIFEKALISYSVRDQQQRLVIQKLNPLTLEKETENMDNSFNQIELQSLSPIIYFEKQEEFSIMSLVKSPYAIMVIMTLLMVFCSSKVGNIEEYQQKLQEQQSKAAQEQVQQQKQEHIHDHSHKGHSNDHAGQQEGEDQGEEEQE